MKEIALYDAKNRLSAVLQELEATGEDVIITRHGKPVARLSRFRNLTPEDRAAAVARLLEIREQTDGGMPPFDWKAAVEDGRE